VFRIARTGGDWIAIGSVFVMMCLLTTVIAVILGLFSKERAWCAMCPMGKLQEEIGKIGNSRKKKI